jgi:hypothetical protein
MLFLLAAVLSAAPAMADTVTIPNASFEVTVAPTVDPYATDVIDSWQKTPVPLWWTAPQNQGGLGYPADQWYLGAGTFFNYGGMIDNIDGNQAAFLFSSPGLGLFQDLAATYVAGQSYQLKVAFEGGGYGMAAGVPVSILLYYRNDTDQMVPVGSATYLNENTSFPLTHLTDCTLDTPAVNAADAWKGKNIGVEILATNGFDAMGGYWDLDNVRLTTAVVGPLPHPGDANNDGTVDVVDLGILAKNYESTGLPHGNHQSWHLADYDDDGSVDVVDLGILAKNYDSTGLPHGHHDSWGLADFDDDGLVDVVDLGILAKNYDWAGAPAGGSAVPVPEPVTLAMLALGGVAAVIRRRK